MDWKNQMGTASTEYKRYDLLIMLEGVTVSNTPHLIVANKLFHILYYCEMVQIELITTMQSESPSQCFWLLLIAISRI